MERVKNILLKSKSLPTELLFFSTALLALYFADINGAQYSLCPLKALKISFCPGCGLGHSLHYIMHGQFKIAWQAYPIGFFALPVIISRIITLIPKPPVKLINYAKQFFL
jgi:hypothetical protein